jgi:hypothetical protein
MTVIFPDSGGTPTTYLLDTFVAADGTLLTSHTPNEGPGGAWTTPSSSCRIEGNRAAAAAGPKENQIDLGSVVDFQADFDFQFLSLTHARQIEVYLNSNAVGDGVGVNYATFLGFATIVTDAEYYESDLPAIADTNVHHVTIRWHKRRLTVLYDSRVHVDLLAPFGNILNTQVSIKLNSTTEDDAVRMDNLTVISL